MSSSSAHSKEFFELIRAIGECKSKQEEDKIILKELALLRVNLQNTKATPKMLREYAMRLVYCEMLGHDASFGYICAANLTGSKNLLEKRVGYLALSLMIPNDHEMTLLSISNLQKDLQSSSFLEICFALTAASKLANEETLPALLPVVSDLRKHTAAAVRKKTIVLIHTFYKMSSYQVPQVLDLAKEALCDRDPSVMGASLSLFEELAGDPQYFREIKDLIPSFANILKQVIENRLPKDFEYHRLPAPWIQIKLLKLFSTLAKDDKIASELIYDLLRETIAKADIGGNIGHAVVYEAVRTAIEIYPSQPLLEQAALAVSRFISSSYHNLKYLGIQALTALVKLNPKYAAQHQKSVIDCLEDTDETLRRASLELLYAMSNSANIEIIVKRLLQFTKTVAFKDEKLRENLIVKIAEISEKHGRNLYWYIDTMNQLFTIDPKMVPRSSISTMMKVIAEGEDSEEDTRFRVYCVDRFYEIASESETVPDEHLQVIAWVLGEYSYLSEKYSKDDVIELLCDLCERQLDSVETRCWVITGLMKLSAQTQSNQDIPETVFELIPKYKSSKNVSLQQRCSEFSKLVELPRQFMQIVLPLDGSCEEIAVDENLAFLNTFVSNARKFGAPEYRKDQISSYTENIPTFNKGLLIGHVERSSRGVVKINAANVADQEFTNDASGIEKIDTSVPGLSLYPASAPTPAPDSGINKSLISKKKWFEEDDEEETTSSQPTLQSPVQQQQNTSTTPSATTPSKFTGIQNPTFSPQGATPSSMVAQPTVVETPKEPEKKSKWDTLFTSSSNTPTVASKLKKNKTDSKNSSPMQQPQSLQATQQQNLISLEPISSSTVTSQQAPKKAKSIWDEEEDFITSNKPSTPPVATKSATTVAPNVTKFSPTTKTISSNSKQSMDELLNFDTMNISSPSQLQQHSSLSAQRNNTSTYDDPFSQPQSNSVPTKKPITSNNNNSSIDDLFSSSTTVMSPSANETSGAFSFINNSSKRRGQLLNDLQQDSNLKLVNSLPYSLVQDSNIQIQYHRFYSNSGNVLVYCLLIGTVRGFTLTNVTLQFHAPSGLEIGEMSSDEECVVRRDTVTFQKCEPGTPISLQIRCHVLNSGFATQIMGNLRYADNTKQTQTLALNLPINVLDILRLPTSSEMITSSEFAQLWQDKSTFEKKTSVKSAGGLAWQVNQVSSKIQNEGHIKQVEIIRMEMICISKFLQQTVLLHFRLRNEVIDITIKCKEMWVTDRVLAALGKLFE